MKVKEPQLARALDAPDASTRLYLLYGDDDATARALIARLARAMGPDAERIDLDGAMLRDDPARLADEAAAISLFGGKQWLRVSGGDECAAAVTALLDAPTAGNPVILIAGALKANGALLKRALDDPAVMACQLFRPDAHNLAALATQMARPMGLRLGRGVEERLAASSLGDRAVVERELEKIALYLDAAPDRPREATIDTLDAVGAALDETDAGRLVDAVMGGDPRAVSAELAAFQGTNEWIPALRALSRRVLLLARLRADVERGKSASAVVAAQGRAIFWKDEKPVTAQLGRWPAARLATAAHRIQVCEGAMMSSGSAGDVMASQLMIDIARVAERLR